MLSASHVRWTCPSTSSCWHQLRVDGWMGQQNYWHIIIAFLHLFIIPKVARIIYVTLSSITLRLRTVRVALQSLLAWKPGFWWWFPLGLCATKGNHGSGQEIYHVAHRLTLCRYHLRIQWTPSDFDLPECDGLWQSSFCRARFLDTYTRHLWSARTQSLNYVCVKTYPDYHHRTYGPRLCLELPFISFPIYFYIDFCSS